METSKNVDRERRRTKPKRKKWVQILLRPQTVTLLVSIGKVAAYVLWLIYLIIGKYRE